MPRIRSYEPSHSVWSQCAVNSGEEEDSSAERLGRWQKAEDIHNTLSELLNDADLEFILRDADGECRDRLCRDYRQSRWTLWRRRVRIHEMIRLCWVARRVQQLVAAAGKGAVDLLTAQESLEDLRPVVPERSCRFTRMFTAVEAAAFLHEHHVDIGQRLARAQPIYLSGHRQDLRAGECGSTLLLATNEPIGLAAVIHEVAA